jgi:hypothetical protein
MKKAILLTAYDRPHYLAPVLDSWMEVRGFDDWPLHVFLEPGHRADEMAALCEQTKHPELTIHRNASILGVLENPYQGFDHLFNELDYDFVLRIEDDLLVSEDVLEFFSWVAETYIDDEGILTAIGFTQEDGEPDRVRRTPSFSPWVWGTWRDRWNDVIGPTWDHDYSTFNGSPGNQAGWDWNLNTRIIPSLGYESIYPLASRVQNIGEYGVHGTPENLLTTTSFERYRGPVRYREIGRR